MPTSENQEARAVEKAKRAWEAATRAWGLCTHTDAIEAMKLGEAMMYAATDYQCALETQVDAICAQRDIAGLAALSKEQGDA